MPTAKTTLDEFQGRGKRRKKDEDPFDKPAGDLSLVGVQDGGGDDAEGDGDDEEAQPGEQLRLINTDHPAHKPLLKLARKVRDHDRDRSDAQAKANEARAELRELMKQHGLTHCTLGDVEITLKPERVSVKERTQESRSDPDD